MSSINPETVVAVLKDQIENYDQKTEIKKKAGSSRSQTES